MSHRPSLLARRPLGRALRLFFIAALLVVGAGTAPAGPTRAEEPVPGSGVSPEGLLNADGTLDLSTGFEGTLDLRGWEVTLDGERGPVLEPASVSAASDPAWGALSNQGLNGTVYALAVMGDDLYVGGTFTQTVDGAVSDLGNIARYDTADDTWHALPNQGLNDAVGALAVVGDDLYVGGDFTQTGDGTPLSLTRIARYDTAGGGTWHALPNGGLNGGVRALALVGDDLYVGGHFTQTGDLTAPLGRIARYDTAGGGTWHAFSNQGLNGAVRALAVVGDDLYVGGDFTQTGDGTPLSLTRIARYDTAGSTWHALPNDGLNGNVYALAVVGGDLYVGGFFTASDDTTVTDLNRIARYDIADDTWNALPKGGLNHYVYALAAVGSDLYLGGAFGETGDGMMTNLNRIARYDTTARTWNALLNQGLSNNVYALAAVGDDLYVGGAFTASGDGTLVNLNGVARYDTTTIAWHALPNQGLNGYVNALAVVGSDLYVGGEFGGYIARYNTAGGIWNALPHWALNDPVYALAVVGDDLYVGGSFTDWTLTGRNYIARYDTADGTWHALPNAGLAGMNNSVSALTVVGDDLYVGGRFAQTVDGTVADLGNVARYDTTSSGTWHALPNQGLYGLVYALAAMGDDLYVGGAFTQTVDGTVADLGGIARYDITDGTWNALPNQGLDRVLYGVEALAVVGDDLYVGGWFLQSGDGTVSDLNHIARYDTAGGTWHALPNLGLNGVVWALAAVGGGLYVGGNFSQTGDTMVSDLNHIARYDITGGTWHALPNQGLNSSVYVLAVVGDDLYVGGAFGATGDGTVTDLGNIARYSLHRHWVYLPLVIRQ